MYEWRVTVNCPVRSLDVTEEFERRGRFHRHFYVWTTNLSPSDAHAEARRVTEGWPEGTTIVAIDPMGMYVWLSSLASRLPDENRDVC
jgi:hypothetical protein